MPRRGHTSPLALPRAARPLGPSPARKAYPCAFLFSVLAARPAASYRAQVNRPLPDGAHPAPEEPDELEANVDNCRFTSFDLHSGHSISASASRIERNRSNLSPHFWQRYSYIGILLFSCGKPTAPTGDSLARRKAAAFRPPFSLSQPPQTPPYGRPHGIPRCAGTQTPPPNRQ